MLTLLGIIAIVNNRAIVTALTILSNCGKLILNFRQVPPRQLLMGS